MGMFDVEPSMFQSQVASPLPSAAASQSVAGAPPISQQPQGMGFMDWIGKIGDIMQSTGAGLQGKPDPVMARRNLESEIAQRKQGMELQRQELEMRRQQQEMAKSKMLTDKLEKVLDIVQKSNIDEKAGTAILESYIQSDPEMAQVFGPHVGKFTLSPQAKVIKRQDYEAKAGEFSDPVSGAPLPAGRYDLEGTPKGGKFVITSLKPSRIAGDTMTGIQAEIITQRATDPATGKLDPDKALSVMKDMRTNPQGAESRIFDYLAEKNKSGKTDPAMEQAIKQYQAIVRGTAAQRSGGAEQGRTDYRATPAFQETTQKTAGSRVTGQLTAQRDAPLGQNAVNYINPDDLTTAPPSMTETEAQGKGYRAFKGANGQQFISMNRAAQNILDRMEVLSKKLLPKSTGDPVKDAVAVRANQVKLAALRQAKDPDAIEFLALRESNLATFAKAAGDAANIAVPEQEFQRKAIPGNSDTQESALRLIESKRQIMRGVVESALGVKPLPRTGGTSVDDWIKKSTGRK